MIVFKDTNGTPLSTYSMQVQPNQVILFNELVPCIANRSLRAVSVENATVEARFPGDVDWIDLVADGIDVSAFALQDVEFEFRLTIGPLKGRYSFDLTVT